MDDFSSPINPVSSQPPRWTKTKVCQMNLMPMLFQHFVILVNDQLSLWFTDLHHLKTQTTSRKRDWMNALN
jgi:hypothetical protein